MQAAARHHYGAASLEGLRVAILGVGAVGMELARLLHEEGAKLIVADVFQPSLEKAEKEFGAEIMSPEDIIAADVDIFSPCALGGSINENTIDRLQAKIVAGAANNQLRTPNMDQALADRGVLYAPDYVINGMGVISVGLEILGQWTEDEIIRRTDGIGTQLTEIFTRAEKNNVPTGAVADELALEIIERGRKAA
ncbi:MAG: hypothetical protein HKP25_11380, partial [Marinicaulis sp.]|nr:hypothetical protein [Marinicaulis sp.]